MADVTSRATGAGGLGTPAARWSMLFIWVTNMLSGLVNQTFAAAPLLWLSACLAALAGSLLVTLPGNERLRPTQALAVVTIAGWVAVAALVSATQVAYLWPLNLAGYLLSFLIARGNTVAGSAGGVLVVAAAVAWALPQAPEPGQVGELVGIPIGFVAAGFAWRLVLRWIVTRQRAHRGEAAQAAEQARLSASALAESHAELGRIRTEVAPLLERIIAGERIDAAFRTELRTTEAAVRDRICAPHLQQPVLVEAIAALRARGVTVVVVGESPEPGRLINPALAEAVANLITPVRTGQVTVRTLPPGRPAALSVVISDEAGPRQAQLDTSGTITTRS